ncbi:MAG: ABC-2 family transporter protein [Oscillospiraceae bacterium]|jgi:ABC-2 type transport system permease protein|nr:ABC-2 family transporter protein [Oscillospiraceae bacterium]
MKDRRFLRAGFGYWLKLFFKYKSNVFFSFFSELAVPMCINILFMAGISGFRAGQLLDLIAYIVVANVIYTISFTYMESTVAEDIKSAGLTYKLLEPIPPLVSYILSDLALKVIRLLLFFVPVLLVLLFRMEAALLAPAFLSLLFACTIGYCLSFLIGCLAFWVTEIWGFSAIKTMLLAVFAGSVFPLSVLPNALQRLLLATPFPYLSYVPSALLLGDISIASSGELLLTGGVWCAILSALAYCVWRAGLKKYESAGV